MRLKSFHGATVDAAMQAVRRELGLNAIIVATREDESGARITAAIDDDDFTGNRHVVAMSSHDALPRDPLDILADSLLSHRVPAAWAERILAHATRALGEPLPVMAQTALSVLAPPLPKINPTRVTMMVGPHGMGKTLALARAATSLLLDKQPLTVIGSDNERAGGREHLAAFTRVLGVSLLEADDGHALADALNLVPTGHHALVDTPGCNPFHQPDWENHTLRVRAFVDKLGEKAHDGITLVLSATLDAALARDLCAPFREAGVGRLLVTGLDLVSHIGPIITLIGTLGVPLVGVSLSPRASVTLDPDPWQVLAEKLVLVSQDKG